MFGTLLLQYILGLESTTIWQYEPVPTQPVIKQQLVTSATVTVQPVVNTNTIAPGTQRVPMLEITFNSQCIEPARLWTLNVQRVGLGASSDIQAIYITQNGNRVSATRSVPQSGELSLSLRDVEFTNCMATIQLTADFSPEAKPFGQHTFTVESVQASEEFSVVTENAIVTNTIPTDPGIVRVINLSPTSRVHIGTNVTVGRIRLESVENNQELLRIVFTNQGSAQNNDLTNFYITSRAGIALSTVTPAMNDKRVQISFVPETILKAGDSIELLLKADYLSSRQNTVDFTIEEPTDVISNSIQIR